MEESKSITKPFEVNVQLSMEQAFGSKKETIEMGKIPHETTIGSIIYAMVATRPKHCGYNKNCKSIHTKSNIHMLESYEMDHEVPPRYT